MAATKNTSNVIEKPAICLVTPDFSGITRNGGIGTAFYNLAQLLCKNGYAVHVLYAQHDWTDDSDKTLSDWKRAYKKQGIMLHTLPKRQKRFSELATTDHARRSLEITDMLHTLNQQYQFNVVHFPDWGGFGYFPLLAKHTQGAFADVQFCIQAHSPTIWHRLNNDEYMDDIHFLHVNFMEKDALGMADHVVSPSQYLLDWYKGEGWKTKQSRVIQNTLNITENKSENITENVFVKEIIFFGRLELRKGLGIFCDAVKALSKKTEEPLKIVFLGKESLVNEELSSEFIAKELAEHNIDWRIEGGLNSEQAQSFLKEEGRLAVIASLLENSPFVVMECLGNQIPFIASDTGGTKELIQRNDRGVLFKPTAKMLTKKLEEVIINGAKLAKLSRPVETTNSQWLEWHNELCKIKTINITEKIPHVKNLFQKSPLRLSDVSCFPELFGASGDHLDAGSYEKLSNMYPELKYLFAYTEGLERKQKALKEWLADFSGNDYFSSTPTLLYDVKNYMEYKTGHLQTIIDSKQKEIEHLQAEYKLLEVRLQNAEEKIQHMEESTTWKMTEPARKAVSLLKKKDSS